MGGIVTGMVIGQISARRPRAASAEASWRGRLGEAAGSAAVVLTGHLR